MRSPASRLRAAPHLRTSARLAGLCVALLSLSPLEAAAAEATDQAAERLDIGELSERVGACFAREDPDCAEPWIAALEKRAATSAAVAYTRGHQALLRGRFSEAATVLARVGDSPMVPVSLKRRAEQYAALARRTATVVSDLRPHPIAAGRAVAWIKPGPDEVMLHYLDDVVGRALPALEAALGPAPKTPIALHLHPRVADLAQVSGLTDKQIEASGTIALCKYNRIMLTSPADLLFGYAWADTVAHELVHYLIIKHGGDGVPVWLHEGIARSFEGLWRRASAARLSSDEVRTLSTARRRGRFIPFARMSPSMARLPSQEATQLAFAEVHHAVIWLLQRAGAGVTPKNAPTGPPDPTAVMARGARRLLALFEAGSDEAAAIAAVLGIKREAFVSAWRRDLNRDSAEMLHDKPSGRRARLMFKRAGGRHELLGELGEEARRYVELGDRLLALERPLAAVIEYRKALARGVESDVLLLTRLARALLRLGQNVEAGQVLTQALEEHPEHAPLLVLQAEALLAEGKAKEALVWCERAAWLNPFDPGTHRAERRAWTALGEKDKAAAALLREEKVAVR